jgi:uncharacterized protein (TIRG00374 family)
LTSLPLPRKRTALVTVLAVALVAWFLRDASLADVWAEVRRARPDMLLLGALAMAAGYLVRVVRWQYLLRPMGSTRMRTAFRATVMGYAASALLPARAGEVLRPFVLARQEGLRATSVFATIVMERVLDLIVVLAMLATFVWSVAGSLAGSRAVMRSVQASGVTAAAAAAALVVALVLVAHHPERISAFALRLQRVLSPRLARRVAEAATAFSAGLAVVRTPRPLAWAVLWSVVLWVVNAVQIWTITLAFGIPMPFAGSFLQQALLVVGVAVPTPAAVGSFHEAYRIGATVFFGATEQAAVGAAIVLHAVAFLPVTVLGVAFMVRDGLTMGRVRRLADDDREVGETV